MQEDMTARILFFAAQIDGSAHDPHRSARSRNWLDDQGRATPDGQALVQALTQQGQTRSVFRWV